jgi:galactonate dehydratase
LVWMKITAIKPYIVPPPVSTDAWCIGKAWILVKVETDSGITGWGESYALEDREQYTAQLVLELAKLIEGMDSFSIKRFTIMANEYFSDSQGVELSSAIAGIEIALWDIVGKALDVPVHRLLGGPCRDRISVYANCWNHEVRSAEQLADYAQEQVAHGFKAVKIYPFLYSDDVDVGIARLQRVREAVGDEVDVLVDTWFQANLRDIGKISDALHKYSVEWFEDPIAPENITQLAEIRQIAGLQIVSGETLYTKQGFRSLLENKAADILNPDIACCGILKINEVAAMAEPYNRKLALHNYNSMSIALAAALQVAALVPNFTSVEYFPRFDEPSSLFADHPYRLNNDGCIALSDEPGLGITIDEEALQKIAQDPVG